MEPYCSDESFTDKEVGEIVLVFGGCSQPVSENIWFLSCGEHSLKNHVETQFRFHIVVYYHGSRGCFDIADSSTLTLPSSNTLVWSIEVVQFHYMLTWDTCHSKMTINLRSLPLDLRGSVFASVIESSMSMLMSSPPSPPSHPAHALHSHCHLCRQHLQCPLPSNPYLFQRIHCIPNHHLSFG